MTDEHLDPINTPEETPPSTEPTNTPAADDTQPEPIETAKTPLSNPTSEQPPTWTQNRLDLSPVSNAVGNIKQELRKVIIGQEKMMDLLIASIFCLSLIHI